ncbi:MAG TPA: YbhN family protein [Solirubrobacteraceae bacterium]|jgi:uncharacterized membrane protein YbhN (UPF0104 family)|nr:YbhN family protein [Solirubrobacteraceae bacterium]
MPADAVAGLRQHLHIRAILIVALLLVVIGAAATLFGWEISVWLKHVWQTITAISVGYLLAAIVLVTLQTATAAFAWFSILRCAYPKAEVGWTQIFACYAAAVALNFVLPANLGTLAMLIMFTTIIAAATFAGIFAGYVVQKAFFTVIGIATYVYLFLTVGGSFSLQFGFVSEHPWTTVILLAGAGMLLYLVARMLGPRVSHWWEEAKDGGQIAARPRAYLARVALPEFLSWLATLGIIAVFLAAYHIPVSFHTVMRVVGGNSIANMTSVTPGGAGVTQGFNVLSLKGITSSSNATAYSIAQQLVTTAWSIVLAIVLLVRAFGWAGGKALVTESYGEARDKTAAEKAARKSRRAAKRAGKAAGEDAR